MVQAVDVGPVQLETKGEFAITVVVQPRVRQQVPLFDHGKDHGHTLVDRSQIDDHLLEQAQVEQRLPAGLDALGLRRLTHRDGELARHYPRFGDGIALELDGPNLRVALG